MVMKWAQRTIVLSLLAMASGHAGQWRVVHRENQSDRARYLVSSESGAVTALITSHPIKDKSGKAAYCSIGFQIDGVKPYLVYSDQGLRSIGRRPECSEVFDTLSDGQITAIETVGKKLALESEAY